MKLGRLIAAWFFFLALLASAFHFLRQPVPLAITPSRTGEIEYCLTCHSDLAQISTSHPVETFGCWSCHGGERLAVDADLAHSTLRAGNNPSDLQVVEQSCGGSDCHSGSPTMERDHIQRVKMSIQGTYAGAISILRFTFGAQSDLTVYQGIYAVQNSNYRPGDPGVPALVAFDPANDNIPSLKKFSENCLYCHLTAIPARKSFFLDHAASQDLIQTIPQNQDQDEFSRFTGCAACHTTWTPGSADQKVHNMTTSMPYTQCNTCHNRGNYDLRQMSFILRSDHPDSRIQDYYQPIAQFVRCEYTLDCIDCHTRDEAMGDGLIHGSKKDAQYTRCNTCHGTLTDPPLTTTIQEPDDLALRLAFLNPVIDLKIGDTIIMTEKGEPLWNTRQLPDGSFELYGKATGQRFTFRPVAMTDCEQNPEEQELRFCHVCHAVER